MSNKKVNRQAGIHLHKTKILRRVKKKKGVASNLVISDEFSWILIARNGKTIARSSETYKRKKSAVYSIEVASSIMTGQIPVSYYDHIWEDGVRLVIF